MAIDKATFPDPRRIDVGFVADESPDVLQPMGNSGIDPTAPYESYKHK
jgi:hypothetical protein